MSLLRRFPERVEERPEHARPPQIFWMPLAADTEAAIRQFDAFDDAVGCGGGRHHVPSELSDRLMMTAVDPAATPRVPAGPKRLAQPRVGRDADFVRDGVLRFIDAV